MKTWFTLGATLLMFACSSSKSQPRETAKQAPDSGIQTPDSGVQTPDIIGAYVDDYGESQRITADSWTIDSSVFHITQVDNARSLLIAHNDSANAYSPGAWSQFDWMHNAENVLFYCQIAYMAASELDAAQTAPADANDPAKGCAGFPWSKLSPVGSDAGAP